MYLLEIVQVPDKKKKSIAVYDTDNPSVHYVIGYINHYEEELRKAIANTNNINALKIILEKEKDS